MSATRIPPLLRAISGVLGLLAAGVVIAKSPVELQFSTGARIGVVS